MKINPYLNFDGTCGDAFRFYAKVLGGKLEIMTMGESPMAAQIPKEQHGRVMHVQLTTPDGAVLMASDCPPDYKDLRSGNAITVALHPETVEDAERLFAELSKGGTVTMPMGETFWAKRFGMATDRFGTPWMVNLSK